MKAPVTQEEIDYRAELTNKINAISSIQGLFTDVEDKVRRLKILKTLLAALNYGDALNEEIDGEIKALEEAAAQAALEAETESAEGDLTVADESEGLSPDDDLGSLESLEAMESFEHSNNSILLEDQEFSNQDSVLLTEDELPSPTDLDAEKDFTENN